VEGCLLYVFNINGFITHLVAWRNGTPDEMSRAFIGGRSAPQPRPPEHGGGGKGTGGSRGGKRADANVGVRAASGDVAGAKGVWW
jgi:hypothetical protein